METPQNPALPPELAAQAAAIEGGQPVTITDEPAADPAAGFRVILAPVVSVSCAVFCPNWAITPPEQGQIIEALIPLCRKYLPENMDGASLPPELAAVMVLAIIAAPRLAAGTPARPPKEVAPDAEPGE